MSNLPDNRAQRGRIFSLPLRLRAGQEPVKKTRKETKDHYARIFMKSMIMSASSRLAVHARARQGQQPVVHILA
jgi:hypothetical protein